MSACRSRSRAAAVALRGGARWSEREARRSTTMSRLSGPHHVGRPPLGPHTAPCAAQMNPADPLSRAQLPLVAPACKRYPRQAGALFQAFVDLSLGPSLLLTAPSSPSQLTHRPARSPAVARRRGRRPRRVRLCSRPRPPGAPQTRASAHSRSLCMYWVCTDSFSSARAGPAGGRPPHGAQRAHLSRSVRPSLSPWRLSLCAGGVLTPCSEQPHRRPRRRLGALPLLAPLLLLSLRALRCRRTTRRPANADVDADHLPRHD